MKFEWDFKKANTNLRKHGVSFEEAASSFYDVYQLAFEDPDHSEEEDREILIGRSKSGRLLLVVYTLRNEVIRIISARCTTKLEARDYAERI